jgi:hypothetical protein
MWTLMSWNPEWFSLYVCELYWILCLLTFVQILDTCHSFVYKARHFPTLTHCQVHLKNMAPVGKMITWCEIEFASGIELIILTQGKATWLSVSVYIPEEGEGLSSSSFSLVRNATFLCNEHVQSFVFHLRRIWMFICDLFLFNKQGFCAMSTSFCLYDTRHTETEAAILYDRIFFIGKQL